MFEQRTIVENISLKKNDKTFIFILNSQLPIDKVILQKLVKDEVYKETFVKEELDSYELKNELLMDFKLKKYEEYNNNDNYFKHVEPRILINIKECYIVKLLDNNEMLYIFTKDTDYLNILFRQPTTFNPRELITIKNDLDLLSTIRLPHYFKSAYPLALSYSENDNYLYKVFKVKKTEQTERSGFYFRIRDYYRNYLKEKYPTSKVEVDIKIGGNKKHYEATLYLRVIHEENQFVDINHIIEKFISTEKVLTYKSSFERVDNTPSIHRIENEIIINGFNEDSSFDKYKYLIITLDDKDKIEKIMCSSIKSSVSNPYTVYKNKTIIGDIDYEKYFVH